MSDLFQDGVTEDVIAMVWRVMQEANWHTFQVLTKRPERMMQVVPRLPRLPNVWLGTSVESAEYLGRITLLRAVPAAVRFVSFEPLLGPIPVVSLRGIHWAIVGGESGPRARPMAQEWVEALRRSCNRQRVAFFFKQWGGTRKKATGRVLNGRTWDEYPSVRGRRPPF
jgi:protein gp37